MGVIYWTRLAVVYIGRGRLRHWGVLGTQQLVGVMTVGGRPRRGGCYRLSRL